MALLGIEGGPNLYRNLNAKLNSLGLAYVHIIHLGNEELLGDIRRLWKQTLILKRPGRAREQIGVDLASGLADLEAYGQMVLANPDFVERLKSSAPLTQDDPATYFGGDPRGCTDYPSLVTSWNNL